MLDRKKAVLLATGLAMALSLTACGSTEEEATPKGKGPAAPALESPRSTASAPKTALPAGLEKALSQAYCLTFSAWIPGHSVKEKDGKVVFDRVSDFAISYQYLPPEKQPSMIWKGKHFEQVWSYKGRKGSNPTTLAFKGEVSADGSRLENCSFVYDSTKFDTSLPGADVFTKKSYSLSVKAIPFEAMRGEGKSIRFALTGADAARAITAAASSYEKFLRGTEKNVLKSLSTWEELSDAGRKRISCQVNFMAKPKSW